MHKHVQIEVGLLAELRPALAAGELAGLLGEGGLRHQLAVLQLVQACVHRLLDVVL